MILKKLYNFGDRLEDKVRAYLSHYPLVYAFIGGAGIIIFWRGIWNTVDFLMNALAKDQATAVSLISASVLPWWDGPLSILFGMILLLLVGLFVSSFIGNEIIISGLKGEKKLAEKTEQEIKADISTISRLMVEVRSINDQLDRLEKKLDKSN
ncbi:MAG: hypothetical protein WC863_02650 [Patescibacteria group bacterium]